MPSNEKIYLTDARVFVAPVGTALPAVTQAYGAAWSGWTFFGPAAGACEIALEGEEIELSNNRDGVIDERPGPEESATIEYETNEFDPNIMAIISRGTVVNTAAASGVPGYRTLTAGGSASLPVWAVGIEGKHLLDNGAAYPTRWLFYRGRVRRSTTISYDATEQTNVPITIKAFKDTDRAAGDQLYRVIEITAPAL